MASKSVCSLFRNVFFRTYKAYLHRTKNTYSQSNISFSNRTHTCGQLRQYNEGQKVVICGWLQYNRLDMFLLLRDWQGLTQVVIQDSKKKDLKDLISNLSYESVIKVTGTVRHRPDGQQNMKMETGYIEVVADEITVLNHCKPILPFELRSFHEVKESMRMEYRYLDLRRTEMQHNIRLRSQFLMKIREFLCNSQGFVDVETPTLFRRTPGGAQEFVVPSRFPGKFYSLPQSPQQFKQLLMVGGIDRYFQIAKCYRDEGAKPDRQPEFTQVDLEMSFTDQENIMKLVEDMLHSSWPENIGSLVTPFARMSYHNAMTRYGVDKPDTRFEMEIHDISTLLESCNVPAIISRLQRQASCQAIVIPQGAKILSNKEFDSIAYSSKEGVSDVTLFSIKVKDDGGWQGGLSKALTDDVKMSISNCVDAKSGDMIVITTGCQFNPHTVLGRCRLRCADMLEAKGTTVRRQGVFEFLWVVDFPLFLEREDGDGVESAHHPFTAPHAMDEDLVLTQPQNVRSQHYDLVLNGSEVGGGSIRIHNSKLQRYILEEVLKEDASELEHLLEALDSGCPPHGGIALGVDRLLAIMCNAKSIRDVIAFPKSHDGKDPMSKSPTEIKQADLELYHIEVKTEQDDIHVLGHRS